MKVGVLGAGVMGAGIAQSMATAGHDAICYDIDAAVIEQAREHVTTGRYGLERGVERGKVTREDADAALARLTFTLDLGEAANVDIVVEAVPEKLELKQQVLGDLDGIAPAHTIFASNTSGFSITQIASATSRPELVIGWHWASPPVVMKFAEIVRTEQTSEATVATVVQLATECGKHPVVINDNGTKWGFVANRVYAAMLREAAEVLEEGVATREQIDALMTDCFNWPVGPYGMVQGASSGWGQ
ncbi:MAG: 3-hydroxyacyl-CoA dehydrogenase family protein [Acidimicrobiia bacterium]